MCVWDVKSPSPVGRTNKVWESHLNFDSSVDGVGWPWPGTRWYCGRHNTPDARESSETFQAWSQAHKERLESHSGGAADWINEMLQCRAMHLVAKPNSVTFARWLTALSEDRTLWWHLLIFSPFPMSEVIPWCPKCHSDKAHFSFFLPHLHWDGNNAVKLCFRLFESSFRPQWDWRMGGGTLLTSFFELLNESWLINWFFFIF